MEPTTTISGLYSTEWRPADACGCIPHTSVGRPRADTRVCPKTAELSHSHILVFARSADSWPSCRQDSASLVAGCCVSASTS
eukprot:300367-Chlamydomonas_euryale.AAC.1